MLAGGAPCGEPPRFELTLEFEAVPRFPGCVTPSAPFGVASDVKSGTEGNGMPLLNEGIDVEDGTAVEIAGGDGRAGKDGVGMLAESNGGRATGGSVEAVVPSSGLGNAVLGSGKGAPRVAVGRVLELSPAPDSRSAKAPLVVVAPVVVFVELVGADGVGANTDGAASPTRFDVSEFELLDGRTGGATRVSAVLIGLMLGFTPGLTPAFTIGIGFVALCWESSSPLRACALGVDSFTVERRLIILDASNFGGSAVLAGLSKVNGTAGPLYDASTVESASGTYDVVLPMYSGFFKWSWLGSSRFPLDASPNSSVPITVIVTAIGATDCLA